MPEWPTNLPFFNLVADMTRSGPQGAVRRTQMDAGPAQVRRITSAAPKARGGRTPPLSLAQLEAFESFFSADLGEGALSFTATDPFDCVERTFRFVGSYEVSRSGRKFSITAELEILP